MQEKYVSIEGVDTCLEGLWSAASSGKGAIVTHPHPLYGGDMHNGVVSAAVSAFHNSGYATLRFNFRGVGRSLGSYADGTGEVGDVQAALAYVEGQDCGAIVLAGYSFGAWVNALAARHLDASLSLVFISPPVDLLDFAAVEKLPGLKLVIYGAKDMFGSDTTIRRQCMVWNPMAHRICIAQADHFYSRHLSDLQAQLETFLNSFSLDDPQPAA